MDVSDMDRRLSPASYLPRHRIYLSDCEKQHTYRCTAQYSAVQREEQGARCTCKGESILNTISKKQFLCFLSIVELSKECGNPMVIVYKRKDWVGQDNKHNIDDQITIFM